MSEIASIIARLEQQRDSIDRAILALREVESAKPAKAVSTEPATAEEPKKRRMSAAGRRRIAEAARKRWADKRVAEAPTATKSGPTIKASKPTKTARKGTAGKAATGAAA